MENLTPVQASILAKAIADAWDTLPPTEEQEFGPQTEAKAEQVFTAALQSAAVTDAGVMPSAEARANLKGQFMVYLESADGFADLTRMEEELTELFTAD